MSKKMKFVVAATGVGILLCIAALSFVLYAVRKKISTYETTIATLEEDLEKDRKAADAEVASAKKEVKSVQKKFDKTFDQLIEVKEELEQLKNEQIIAGSTVETSDSTPEPTSVPESTPIYTEFDDGKCYMNICGTFTEPGFGRVQIRVEFHDASAPDDYVVTIQGSNGAADNSTWTLTANWDAASSSLIYAGSKIDTVNGVSTSYDNITGSLRFEDPNTLYWTDASSGNTDRGPFTKN